MAKELALQKTAVNAGKNYVLLRSEVFLNQLMGFWHLLVGVFISFLHLAMRNEVDVIFTEFFAVLLC